ncbi:MAG TPA: hypothetical protein VGI23_06140, partial [Steroidobacteraceae bacterium]
MRSSSRLRWFGVAFVVAAFSSVSLGAGSGEPRLAFDVREGLNINSFLREGDVASHVVLRSGTQPRILVTFPAGNSSVGLWFEALQKPAEWLQQGKLQPIREPDEKGRPLRGVATDLTIAVPELRVRAAVLSSTRVLRDFQALHTVPP